MEVLNDYQKMCSALEANNWATSCLIIPALASHNAHLLAKIRGGYRGSAARLAWKIKYHLDQVFDDPKYMVGCGTATLLDPFSLSLLSPQVKEWIWWDKQE